MVFVIELSHNRIKFDYSISQYYFMTIVLNILIRVDQFCIKKNVDILLILTL